VAKLAVLGRLLESIATHSSMKLITKMPRIMAARTTVSIQKTEEMASIFVSSKVVKVVYQPHASIANHYQSLPGSTLNLDKSYGQPIWR